MATQGIVLLLISYVSPIFPIKSHSISISGPSCFLKPRNSAPHWSKLEASEGAGLRQYRLHRRDRGLIPFQGLSWKRWMNHEEPVDLGVLWSNSNHWVSIEGRKKPSLKGKKTRSLKFSHRHISTYRKVWCDLCVADKKQTFGDVQSPKKTETLPNRGMDHDFPSLNKNTMFFSGSMLVGGMLDPPNWTNGD